ncbi:MAG: hypothetical protein K2W96_18015 [Gemmataceae bacterium]|nr:hypothetical protein [Gemmataceae bacterium]
MAVLPVTRVVLYKHGVGYFEREGPVEGDAALGLTFKQAEVSDVLKSLTVLDLDGGHMASISYDSTKPLEQLLAEVAISIPDDGSLVGLLPQIKGARIAVTDAGQRTEGVLLGIDHTEKKSADGVVTVVLVSLLTDGGGVRSFDLHGLDHLDVLDAGLKRDLDYYLRTQLSAKKKDARTFTFFARGEGKRRVRVSYTLEAPVWKATYRILMDKAEPALIQGWAVVDNTQDEDWEGVTLSLIAGLPVSFVHDLYTPRYIRRPVVAVKETTGVLPPEVEQGMAVESMLAEFSDSAIDAPETVLMGKAAPAGAMRRARGEARQMERSAPAQVRERKLGDLFEYEIEHPVTIRRNQSALVPIVMKKFDGRSVLLHNRQTRPGNPMRAVELKNSTGLTLEGGPVTVLEGSSYVGEAMLDTLKPDEERLVPYAVELGVQVIDNIDSHDEAVHKLVIRDGRLVATSLRVQKTTYRFDNKGDEEQTLYIDHPRDGGSWKLHDSPKPHETTENTWRFKLPLPAKKVTAFVVQQQYPMRSQTQLGHLDANGLLAILDQKHLDDATRQVLKQAATALKKVSEYEQRIVRLEQERERIHGEQGRIRDNLGALGDKSGEKELRTRLVKTLNDQEDRLEAIGRDLEKLAGERDTAREAVTRALAGLDYESGRE